MQIPRAWLDSRAPRLHNSLLERHGVLALRCLLQHRSLLSVTRVGDTQASSHTGMAAVVMRCSTSWAECGRNEPADGWCKYEPNESFWDIWSSAEFSVNSSLSRFFQSARKYRVPPTGLFGHVGVGGGQPSQQFCGSSFGAADVAHALDGLNRVPQQQAFGSAFEALGKSSKSAFTPDALLRALQIAVTGERKFPPSWGGAVESLRPWLKSLALWEMDNHLPQSKWVWCNIVSNSGKVCSILGSRSSCGNRPVFLLIKQSVHAMNRFQHILLQKK